MKHKNLAIQKRREFKLNSFFVGAYKIIKKRHNGRPTFRKSQE